MSDRTHAAPSTAADEIAAGKRFGFGRNWQAFLRTLDEGRIAEAERSLSELLDRPRLDGLRFLDIGCGSGLFSLAARRLGATVDSFDFDLASVACAQQLKQRFFPDDPNWTITAGSAIDPDFMRSLPEYDIVYSWGVLHHTGDMWRGLELAGEHVKPGGLLSLALYNEQGWKSRAWRFIKRTYCCCLPGRLAVWAAFVPTLAVLTVIASLLRRENLFRTYRRRRGMSVYYDWIDWLGGYPFEVAKPEQVLDFYRDRGFELVRLTTTNSLGNNEFVFLRR